MSLSEDAAQSSDAWRFDAFISYRHVARDRRWAKWLHTQLETYTLPKKIQRQFDLPARLQRVFRDEEELPVSSSLSHQIDQALQRSRFLIVVCSRDTPESRWVNQEILRFREMGRHDQILALLVDGEPGEAFPQALCEIRTELIDTTGKVSERNEEIEPLAADVRPSREEKPAELKRMALLRILAMIHGCRFDDLRQRHQERASRRMAQLALAGLTLATVMTALSVFAVLQKQEAENQRNIAEQREFDSRHRLAALRVAEGWRQVGLNRPHLALPWVVQAYRDDPRPNSDKLAHRVRIASLINSLPSLTGGLFSTENEILWDVFPDAMRALVKRGGKLAIIQIDSRETLTEFDTPTDFVFLNISRNGQYLLGLRRLERQPVAVALDTEQNLAEVFATPIDLDPDVLFELRRSVRPALYLPEYQSMAIGRSSGVGSRLYIAQTTDNNSPVQEGFHRLSAFAISPQAGLVATVESPQGEEVRYWDLRAKRWRTSGLTLEKYSTTHALAFTHTGRQLAVMGANDVTVYNVADARRLAQSTVRVLGVYELHFSSDDQFLVLRGTSGTEVLELDDSVAGRLRSIAVHREAPHQEFDARIALDDNVFVNATLDRVMLQQPRNGLNSLVSIQVPGLPGALHMSESAGDTVRIRQGGMLTSWRLLNQGFGNARINEPNSMPESAVLWNDGRVAWVDLVNKQLSVTQGHRLLTVDLADDAPRRLAGDSAGTRIALATASKRVFVLSSHDPTQRLAQYHFHDHVIDLQFSKKHLLVLTGPDPLGQPTAIHGWRIDQSGRRWRVEPQATIHRIASDPEGRILLAALNDAPVQVVDTESGKLLGKLDHQGARVVGIAGEKNLIITASGNAIMAWHPETLELVNHYQARIFGAFAAGGIELVPGRNLFVGKFIGRNPHLRLYDLFTGEPRGAKMFLNANSEEMVERIAVSANGELIAALGSQGSVQVWSAADGSKVSMPYQIPARSMMNLGSFVQGRDLLFSPNGHYLVALANDAAIYRQLPPTEMELGDVQHLADVLSMHRIDPAGGLQRIGITEGGDLTKKLVKQLR